MLAIRILGFEGWGEEISPDARGLLFVGWGLLAVFHIIEFLLKVSSGLKKTSTVPLLLAVSAGTLAFPQFEDLLLSWGSPPGTGISLALASDLPRQRYLTGCRGMAHW